MSIRFILVLISFIFLQNTPSVSGAGYVRFINFSPDEIFITVNSVTEPSVKSGAFTGFFSYPSGSQSITVVDTTFAKTYTNTFSVTDMASKFITITSDGGSSFLLSESPDANVTTAPAGFGSILLVNSATTDLAVSVDGAVSGPYSPGDFSSEILVNTTAATSLTNTTQRNITVELVVTGAGTKSFTLQLQSQAKYLVLVGVHSNNTVKYSLIQYAANTVQLTHVCNQVWTATNPDPYPITFKWDWRPRQKRFEMTLDALASKLLVVETKQNANSKKVYTYQYDSNFLTSKVVQTLFSKKCLSVSSVCRGMYKLTNLATTTLPVVYQSFSPSGLNDGNYTTLTNDTYVTLDVNTVTSINTTAVNATYFKTGYEEVFKVWLSVEGVKSRLLATFQGAVSQGSKCT